MAAMIAMAARGCTLYYCNDKMIVTGKLCDLKGERYLADMTNTCIYYSITTSKITGKCEETIHHCPPGKKVSENLYFRPGSVCLYDIDIELADPCERRNSYLELVYEMSPWEGYGSTNCNYSRTGQKAEACVI